MGGAQDLASQGLESPVVAALGHVGSGVEQRAQAITAKLVQAAGGERGEENGLHYVVTPFGASVAARRPRRQGQRP